MRKRIFRFSSNWDSKTRFSDGKHRRPELCQSCTNFVSDISGPLICHCVCTHRLWNKYIFFYKYRFFKQKFRFPCCRRRMHVITKYLHIKSTEQCLASSELLTPHPLSTQRVCLPPAPKAGGVHTCQGVKGWGVNSSEDARHWIGLLQYNPSTHVILLSRKVTDLVVEWRTFKKPTHWCLLCYCSILQQRSWKGERAKKARVVLPS